MSTNYLTRLYSLPNPNSKPVVAPENKDEIMENILAAKGRRGSWQASRRLKSFVHSLSVICKWFLN